MKFAYITDTHFGGDKNCWGQQTTYPELLPKLFNKLSQYLKQNPVDFILHGGDITNNASPQQLHDLDDTIAQLPAPLRLTLGNHDLSHIQALSLWKEKNNTFPSNTTATGDFTIEMGPVTLLAMTNSWSNPNGDNPFYWDSSKEQTAGFTDTQYDWLEAQLNETPEKPFILTIHETLYSLPPRLTGMPEPIHKTTGPYINKIKSFINTHPQIKLILSGHCHASCLTIDNSQYFVTTSAYFEPPFQIRIIDINNSSINLDVAYPCNMEEFDIPGTPESFWSAGQQQDRKIYIPL
jgi:3',5'-cyclic AMP phosphodiesterase CpdA